MQKHRLQLVQESTARGSAAPAAVPDVAAGVPPVATCAVSRQPEAGVVETLAEKPGSAGVPVEIKWLVEFLVERALDEVSV